MTRYLGPAKLGYRVNWDNDFLFKFNITNSLANDAWFIIVLPPESDANIRANYNSVDCFEMADDFIEGASILCQLDV